MKAHYLGHVAFYRDLLGFQKVGSIFNGAAAALVSGRAYHELLLIQVRDAPAPPSGGDAGSITSA
jgi:catechol 2,3-dioxygenase